MENIREDYKLNTVRKFHLDSQKWKSSFFLINDELAFIEHLLHSYVFEPNTPNLFERLQDYLERLKVVKSYKAKIQELIAVHENRLGGTLECKDGKFDEEIHAEHEKLKAKVADCIQQFQILKTEIFNYAGGILKRRRPC